MKNSLTLLFASAALTAAIGVPAVSALRPGAEPPAAPAATVAPSPVVLADADRDDDREPRRTLRRDRDDEDDENDEDRRPARSPAPAGTVTPPKNGLFGDGTLPQVEVK